VLDNLREFGTLKAIGCTNLDLSLLLFCQAALYALIAGSLSASAWWVTNVVEGIRNPKLVPIIPPVLRDRAAPPSWSCCALVASTLALDAHPQARAGDGVPMTTVSGPRDRRAQA
jgi:hypothetical protein